ncbi:mitochondrial inner membrane protease ATP23 homolog [Neodiprion fabricii]|uniref:mitochondrial inner membrane protease ATP23 homolog n=1 Tax=Neodiprion fabricii TaxID=2872261 RepID=UPI001ED8ED1B|nr:mitochondrial inner membrane protease ATP23 homolog [Neodiprion fabricii]
MNRVFSSINDSSTSAKEPEFSQSTQSNSSPNNDNWGYDLYPERKGAKYKPTWTRRIMGLEGREELDKMKCERNVYSCVVKHPVIKLMMASLKSNGCPFDIRRHISCEVCDHAVTGGYDPITNQIVVCQNTAPTENQVGGVMSHEMIHMFDWCVNDLDFKNLDHLACTEIRAANLTHCSFMSAWFDGSASPFNIRQTHGECVKIKAMTSVMAARNVTKEEATAAIDRVFPKCYADLEPIGRRIRRNSEDMERAYAEGPMYGYGT